MAPSYLRLLAKEGGLIRISRGLFSLPDHDLSENHSLATVSAWQPRAIICLFSAARFHDLGRDTPHGVWTMLARGTKQPRNPGLPQLEVVWVTDRMMNIGVETHTLEGVPVQITSMARTVVDLFRFRQKVGLESAIDALRDALRREVPHRELREQAEASRTWNRIRPYVEAMTL